jgi:UPF0755 protein
MRISKKSLSKYRIKFFVVAIILLLLIPVVRYYSFINTPVSTKKRTLQVKITKGMSSTKIINKLFDEGLIKSKIFAKIYMKTNNIDSNLKAGVYKFSFNMTPKQIFGMLKNREIDLDFVSFTIPEGYDIKHIADKLYNLGVIKSQEEFYNAVQNDTFNYDFISNISVNRTYRLEGYLFPATYEFEKGMSIHIIIDEMLNRFNLAYKDFKEELKGKDISLDKAIIIASMIEGEARIDNERPLIAAVIFNRLRKNMYLQIDATVQYALGVHKEVIYYKDLKVKSAYNTYNNKGLPIGPIGNPSIKSFEAVLNPANVNYLYYIAKGDGGHFFTNSYQEFIKFKHSLKK